MITRHRLSMLDVDTHAVSARPIGERVQAIYDAFLARVPYENLSNNRVVQASADDPDSWPRATDRLLRENAAYGLGGTSFSLAYALRDLFRGASANAHCTLGYNLVTEQAHAAVLVYVDEGPLLYDPALLIRGPIPVRPGGVFEDPLGRISLLPRAGPTLTVSLRLHRNLAVGSHAQWTHADMPIPEVAGGATAERPIYSIIPIPAAPQNYRQAWLASFYRGRPMPLRIARRVGDDIVRYGERPGSVETLRVSGREEICLGPNPVAELHELFGIDTGCLQEWFGESENAAGA